MTLFVLIPIFPMIPFLHPLKEMPVQQLWIHLSVGQTCVHVVAAGYTQNERKPLLSSCPCFGGKGREQVHMDMTGSRGTEKMMGQEEGGWDLSR